ncbi:MAG: copper amine oxidase N-terminal domain-containing protein [Caldiserica bacterium]|nr:copper amine oxidase N-terminal domain-containing protein [Caldisericota bacterium]
MRKVLSLLIILLMITILLIPVNHQTKAATFAVVYYPKYLPADCTTGTTTPGNGTPFAVYFQLKGFIPNTLYALKSVIGPYPSDMTYAISWKNETTNSWADYYTAYTSLLKITTDSSGDWSGWLVAKLKSTALPSGTLLYRVRMRVSPFTDNYYVETLAVGVTSLNMTTQGGWIEGHAYVNGSPAANKVIIVKDGSNNIVGTYLTEDNSVNEGYNPLDVGYFKVATPAGSDYLIEMLDSSDSTILASINNISVTAGAVTSGINIYATVNNSPALDWTGETNYISDGLNPEVGNNLTDFMYRIKYTDADNDAPQSGYPRAHILKDSSEISGSPFSMIEADPADITFSNGKIYNYSTILSSGDYTYFFEAKDANSADATGVSLSSNIGPSVLPIINALSNTGGTITPSGDIAVNYGADQAFTITPEIGYHIADVKVDGVSVGAVSTYIFHNVTTDHTIEATFAINTYTLDVTVVGNGSVTKDPDQQTYDHGTTVTLTATPDTGYHFVSWSGDVPSGHETDNPLTITMDSDKSITATFVINTYIITASADEHGSVTPVNQVVNYGDPVSVTIIPDSGYCLASLIDNCTDVTSLVSGNTYIIPSVKENHTIMATFVINTYTVTITAGYGGSITPYGAVIVCYDGTQAFVITPNQGYHIREVLIDGMSIGAVSSYTFTNVTTNHTIEAFFEINTYTITTTVGSGGSISPSGIVIVNYGDSKTFTINSDPKFVIFMVLVDGHSINFTNPKRTTYTFSNISSNHTISAEFMKIPDITPPSLTLPKVGGIDLNLPGAQINTSSDIFTFTVEASDESGIARMVVKVNGVVQIDKNNLDPTIYLSEGENLVEVKVYDTYGNYTTKSFKIFKDSKPPVVNLTVPETSSTSSITITGLIFDEGSGVKSVLINGTEYMVPSLGSFSVTLTLTPGVNTIQVKATDKIGNFTTKTYSVNYTPITSTSTMITLKIGSPYITINGISKKIDAQGNKPIIKDGRTLLPIRTLIESLGGKTDWEAKERKVTITLNGHSIILWIGKTTALVDGNKVTLDVASQIINDRTYIPLRFVAENLNASVQWDQSAKTVTIYYWL